MHDAAQVGGVHDLGDELEERDELRERHRPARLQPSPSEDALDELHRDPPDAVVLDAEGVHVRGNTGGRAARRAASRTKRSAWASFVFRGRSTLTTASRPSARCSQRYTVP